MWWKLLGDFMWEAANQVVSDGSGRCRGDHQSSFVFGCDRTGPDYVCVYVGPELLFVQIYKTSVWKRSSFFIFISTFSTHDHGGFSVPHIGKGSGNCPFWCFCFASFWFSCYQQTPVPRLERFFLGIVTWLGLEHAWLGLGLVHYLNHSPQDYFILYLV